MSIIDGFKNFFGVRAVTADNVNTVPPTANDPAATEAINRSKERILTLARERDVTPGVGLALNTSLFDNAISNKSTIKNTKNDTSVISTDGQNTTILNDADNNTIRTGKGNDFISNNGDKNRISTGRGNDVISNNGDANTIRTGSGKDYVDNTGDENIINTGSGDDLVYNTGDANRINLGLGNDVLESTGDENVIDSGRGNDTLSIIGNSNSINSGSGEDFITINGKDNSVDAGSGNDTISLGKDSTGSKINAGSGNDKINVGQMTKDSKNTINGGEGTDTVTLTGSANDYKVATNKDGSKTYTHNTSNAALTIGADVENVAFTGDRITDEIDLVPFPGERITIDQIDFGDISKEQAKELYNGTLNSVVDLEAQQSDALALNTDAGRTSSAALNTELKLSRHVAKELERQFGFEKDDVFPNRYDQSKFFVDLNEGLLKDLKAQMGEALKIDSQAGRVAAAALRTEITNAKSLIAFWRETASFWKP
ncbi:MAG: calcium-binding protein [bacterium]